MSSKLFDLGGKVALVTGGNSGIGLGFAEGLAEAGASVCIWGTNPEKNRAAEERLESFGGEVLAQQCDVGEPDDIQEKFAAMIERFGRVDSCFANAGVGGRGTPFLNMTLDEWRGIFRINMEGAFLTLQAAARQMATQGSGGSLVVTSSVSYISGAPRSEHYAATKGGVVSLIRWLCVEFGRKGIRANAVVPGWIDTPMTDKTLHTKPFEEKVRGRIPAGRWGTPEDFRGIAVYFASDASAYHSGDAVVLDGGYVNF